MFKIYKLNNLLLSMDKLQIENLGHNNMDNIEALWDLANMAFELENTSIVFFGTGMQ